jgi:two-component system sensor histidine kinase QseC
MKSIRRRLTLWFLLGTGTLWLAAGIGIFLSYRAGLLAGAETELHSLTRQLRGNQMGRGGGGGGRGWGGPPNAAETMADRAAEIDFGPDVFWQVWPLDGGAPERSANLAEDLPRFGSGHGENSVRTITLKNGVRAMAIGESHGMGPGAETDSGRGHRGRGGRNRGIEIVVAKDLASVDRALTRAAVLILLSGLLGAALVVSWILFVLRDGLSPLRRIADEVAGIDAESLSGRISEENLPEELHPIVVRLNQLLGRMEESFARERRFSSDLAHEMRTPIAELRLLTESALKWPEDSGPETWQTVHGSVHRMETVVQAMLQLARLEETAPKASGETLPLRPMIEEIWSSHASRAAARNIALRLEIAPDTSVRGDPALWRHLLDNLLGNAADYADEGSEVLAAATPARGDVPSVRIVNAAAALKPDDAERIFDRFWRSDSARSESEHCGLGLALARACAENMGCRLTAQILPENNRLEMRIEAKSSK